MEEVRITLKSFQILEKIGEGGSCNVFLVKKSDRNEYFALKVIPKNNVQSRQNMDVGRIERDFLVKHRNPCIVGIEYAFETKGKYYLVLEFLNGGDLFYHVSRYAILFNDEKAIPEDIVVRISSEIVVFLEFLDENNLIYRSMKPENVLIDRNGYAKVCDFGFIKSLKKNEKTNELLGTSIFMPPEIIRKEGYNRIADLYGLGVIIYSMLFVGNPYMEIRVENVVQAFDQILSNELYLPSNDELRLLEISQAGKDLCQKLLKKKPEERIRLDEVKKHPFFKSVDWDRVRNRESIPGFEIPPKSYLDGDVSRFPQYKSGDNNVLEDDSEDMYDIGFYYSRRHEIYISGLIQNDLRERISFVASAKIGIRNIKLVGVGVKICEHTLCFPLILVTQN